ncbi:hypothetical protein [Halomonas sp. RT37]|uniref:Collagen-like protein n=1 Tax=Halomonas sp. RT37 TaxID=2950872 RepID=A0AAU7KEV4_9GAMM
MRTSIAATMLTVALSAGLLAAKAPIAMASTLSRAVAENDHRQPAIPHPPAAGCGRPGTGGLRGPRGPEA